VYPEALGLLFVWMDFRMIEGDGLWTEIWTEVSIMVWRTESGGNRTHDTSKIFSDDYLSVV
jgi:hypothetical protein